MRDAAVLLMVVVVAMSVGLTTCSATWVAAHSYVAAECKNLGGFFVGDQVFECKPKENAK